MKTKFLYMVFILWFLIYETNTMQNNSDAEKRSKFYGEIKKVMGKNVIRPLHARLLQRTKIHCALPQIKSMLLSENCEALYAAIVVDLKKTNLFTQIVEIDADVMNIVDLRKSFDSLKPNLPTLIVIQKLDVMAPPRVHHNSTLETILKTEEVLTILNQYQSVPGLFILGLTNELEQIDTVVTDYFQEVHKLEKPKHGQTDLESVKTFFHSNVICK